MNMVEKQMHERVAAGCDPLTGDKMETVGNIGWKFDADGYDLHLLTDETGREVTLDTRGNWVYKTA